MLACENKERDCLVDFGVNGRKRKLSTLQEEGAMCKNVAHKKIGRRSECGDKPFVLICKGSSSTAA